ncbi:helix-turn-helix transcriptional regulator [Lactobacillus crispatus]|uniref:helix-turn-helix transcriptional regulator n=1 Tax=Lactobacillus crispatus TaxID=47770 RepID=UPI003F2486A5
MKRKENAMVSVLKEDAAEKAKKYLRTHGIKQSWVADKMGISEPLLSGRLNGRYNFDADFALSFSKALNISPNIFLK